MNHRKEHYSFLDQLQISSVTANIYKSRLNGTVVKQLLKEFGEYNTITDITDINIVYKIYQRLLKHPSNKQTHNSYACAVKKYIDYLEATQSSKNGDR